MTSLVGLDKLMSNCLMIVEPISYYSLQLACSKLACSFQITLTEKKNISTGFMEIQKFGGNQVNIIFLVLCTWTKL